MRPYGQNRVQGPRAWGHRKLLQIIAAPGEGREWETASPCPAGSAWESSPSPGLAQRAALLDSPLSPPPTAQASVPWRIWENAGHRSRPGVCDSAGLGKRELVHFCHGPGGWGTLAEGLPEMHGPQQGTTLTPIPDPRSRELPEDGAQVLACFPALGLAKFGANGPTPPRSSNVHSDPIVPLARAGPCCEDRQGLCPHGAFMSVGSQAGQCQGVVTVKQDGAKGSVPVDRLAGEGLPSLWRPGKRVQSSRHSMCQGPGVDTGRTHQKTRERLHLRA